MTRSPLWLTKASQSMLSFRIPVELFMLFLTVWRNMSRQNHGTVCEQQVDRCKGVQHQGSIWLATTRCWCPSYL